MRTLSGAAIAAAGGAEVLSEGPRGGPERAVIDSRSVTAGDLFFGLPGERHDGGQFALEALRRGAWGVLAGPQWVREIVEMRKRGVDEFDGWVMASADPLPALQGIARRWRRELGCAAIGITGSTGKTSVKDVCRALLPARVHASPENYNTEIGLPLAVLAAPEGTEALVLEMGMRGAGQIAELCEVAEPDVGVITNVGPVHVELLGSLEAVAAAKAEIITGLRPGGTAVVPAVAGPLEPYLAGASGLLRFGDGGDVYAEETSTNNGATDALVATPAGEQRFRFPFTEGHNLDNALAAIAAGVALGMPLDAMAQRAPRITFSRLRGELVRLPRGTILINDCYNANPVSMRAALDHLASLDVGGRRLAVLGDMLELGPDAARYHREIGEHVRAIGVQVLIGVGELAADYAPDLRAADAAAAAEALEAELGEGDAVLVKGSRAIGLELVAERLEGGDPGADT
ncbi:MAG TPA: UDP-N-acetylmuramoyl-tripeptide--D-alanyl-D-alanine ligase [Solirubrobacterales bacterium]|nr:UDP-N-acetylmuramoyl-tripeptide--D-alanyl-D-alanine ligase [Solirubrobacterales bacterium]